MWAIIGDHDHKRDVLGLANVNSGKPCSHCPCDRKGTPWWDFSLSAEWARKVYNIAVDLSCVLLRMSAGLSILSVYPDWMHDKYLGTDKVYTWRGLRFFVCSVVLMFAVELVLWFCSHALSLSLSLLRSTSYAPQCLWV